MTGSVTGNQVPERGILHQSGDVKTVFFALFIFSLGYLAGPQFFANLNRRSTRGTSPPVGLVKSSLQVAARLRGL
ncbi:hypothetical protein, partial [Streptomyces violascens]|uniref:hypothetical protein n=1 Tax=Streptomyces violascens TaxID=67381 RepID=UPI0036980A75